VEGLLVSAAEAGDEATKTSKNDAKAKDDKANAVKVIPKEATDEATNTRDLLAATRKIPALIDTTACALLPALAVLTSSPHPVGLSMGGVLAAALSVGMLPPAAEAGDKVNK
jgi:hypothetical protein